ncbi:hypothetical protein Scep_019284 [Stephania cephalantha]|uniref:Uncharacterized protein n=1 Tax=Stephania cephalantha TaxID=152367 RepID=A0AAP0IAW2_9MAGN
MGVRALQTWFCRIKCQIHGPSATPCFSMDPETRDDLEDKLVSNRRTSDRLRPNKVTWDPCIENRSDGMVHPMTFYDGTLKYMDIMEPYHPERFLRQLGHVQDVPAPSYRPLEASRGPSALK